MSVVQRFINTNSSGAEGGNILLTEAEKKQAICDFLGLDLTQEADKMFMANLEAFEETSRLMFGNFKESGK
jgi:hypothetical protein